MKVNYELFRGDWIYSTQFDAIGIAQDKKSKNLEKYS
jgi:hypothetical protein